MKRAICHLKSISPYSQSKFVPDQKESKELHKDYEHRIWREKMHYDKDGIVFIPPLQFCNSLKEAAKFLNRQIPGKGKQTYTKHFEAGVMVVKALSLGIHKDEVELETVHVPSDGRRGGTTRVLKNFPIIHEWKGEVEYLIIDEIITQDIFEEVLYTSGNLIGVGRFRPRNWGYYGRFEPVKIEWFKK